MRNRSSGLPTRSDTNRAVQPQKMARGLKFWLNVVEGLYYQCSENKGADQLRGYREPDLRLCFRICKKPVFSRRDSNVSFPRGRMVLKMYSKRSGKQLSKATRYRIPYLPYSQKHCSV